VRRRLAKADLRCERAVVVRVERREETEESRAFCWNWKGAWVEGVAAAVVGENENVLGMEMLGSWLLVVVMVSLSRNGWLRWEYAGGDDCALLLLCCIEFSSAIVSPLCFVVRSVMKGCRLWALAWLARRGLGDLGW